MDLRILDKSPHVASLLVRLYDSHKLYGLLEEGKPQARQGLAHAVAELFETELSVREEEVLSDVLIGLMRKAELELRYALSVKLSAMDTVPLRLVLHLANDEIKVASPLLEASEVLSDMDLIYIVKSQGPEYWQAIAKRHSLGDDLINVLADTNDVGTAVNLSENERVTLTEHAVSVLSEIAKNNKEVAGPLLQRAELPVELARAIHEHVAGEMREYIDVHFQDAAPIEIDMVVEQVIHEQAPDYTGMKFLPSRKVINQVAEDKRRGFIDMDLMVHTLQKGDIPRFIAQFSAYTGISLGKVHDFIMQSCPKGLAIACKAYKMQKTDFSRVYLLTHRARSSMSHINQSDMMKMMDYFDSIKTDIAEKIVSRTVRRQT